MGNTHSGKTPEFAGKPRKILIPERSLEIPALLKSWQKH
jgi:hypothetical protein